MAVKSKLLFNLLAILSFLFLSVDTYAEVYVAERWAFQDKPQSFTLEAGQVISLPLSIVPNGKEKHKIRFSSQGTLFSDINVYVCDDKNKDYVLSSLNHGCSHFPIDGDRILDINNVNGSGKWLIIDNRHSVFSSKNVSYTKYTTFQVDEHTSNVIQSELSNVLTGLQEVIISPVFDMNIAPCGTANAFSEQKSGAITLCTELLYKAVLENNMEAFFGIFTHELGHTFLNLWGSPNFTNEKTVDEFAAALLFIIENIESKTPQPPNDLDVSAQNILEGLIQFFSDGSNVQGEVGAAFAGNQHPLSIQRINHLRSIISNPIPFVKRWTSELYPKLTTYALQQIIDKPHIGANIDLAKDIIKNRQSCVDVELDPVGCKVVPVSTEMVEGVSKVDGINNTPSLTQELLSLSKLYENGILSEEEFEKAKAKILDK